MIFSIIDEPSKKNMWIGRMWNVPLQLILMILSLVLASKNAKCIEEDSI